MEKHWKMSSRRKHRLFIIVLLIAAILLTRLEVVSLEAINFLTNIVASVSQQITRLPELILRFLVFVVGIGLVLRTVLAASRAVLIPLRRSDPIVTLTMRFYFRILLRLVLRTATTYEQRDSLSAYFAPAALITVPVIWLTFIALGYSAMPW